MIFSFRCTFHNLLQPMLNFCSNVFHRRYNYRMVVMQQPFKKRIGKEGGKMKGKKRFQNNQNCLQNSAASCLRKGPTKKEHSDLQNEGKARACLIAFKGPTAPLKRGMSEVKAIPSRAPRKRPLSARHWPLPVQKTGLGRQPGVLNKAKTVEDSNAVDRKKSFV